jgi:hypothetical protein
MDDTVRKFVRERARDRCEYCRLPQSTGALLRFHVEHVLPRQHGGSDIPDNLALACPNCNWHKGPNLAAIDPETKQVALLFNPRIDGWEDHFEWQGVHIVGRTSSGRATASLLRFNAAERVDVRRELELLDEAP